MAFPRLLTVLLAAYISVAGCSDPAAPTVESVAGSYTATSFQAEGTDVLAAGGSLALVLTSTGQMTGQFLLPASVGGPLDSDMAGTYELDGNRILIEQEADTFVRDAEWRWDDGVLTGSYGTGPKAVTIRMMR